MPASSFIIHVDQTHDQKMGWTQCSLQCQACPNYASRRKTAPARQILHSGCAAKEKTRGEKKKKNVVCSINVQLRSKRHYVLFVQCGQALKSRLQWNWRVRIKGLSDVMMRKRRRTIYTASSVFLKFIFPVLMYSMLYLPCVFSPALDTMGSLPVPSRRSLTLGHHGLL